MTHSAEELGGDERFVSDGLASPDECQTLVRLCEVLNQHNHTEIVTGLPSYRVTGRKTLYAHICTNKAVPNLQPCASHGAL